MKLDVEVKCRDGKPATLLFVMSPRRVEVRVRSRRVGDIDRDELRSWLRQPYGQLAFDDVTLRQFPAGGLAVTVEACVPSTELSKEMIADLRLFV